MTGESAPVGIAWYAEEDYSAIRTIMTDSSMLPDTYAEWLLKAEDVESDLLASGNIVIRADIDPTAFQAWCLERGLIMDTNARSSFANEAAYPTRQD